MEEQIFVLSFGVQKGLEKEDRMKKVRICSWLLVCLLAVSMTSAKAFANETEKSVISEDSQKSGEKKVSKENKRIITIYNIISSLFKGKSDSSSTKISIQGGPSDVLEILNEEWICPDEIIIHGEDLEVQGGKYNFKLTIRSNGTLTFDNDLEVYYQGINGKYKLNYEIDETDNHIMIVTGTFDNIIIKSPLLEKLSDKSKNWILSHISEDTYFYQLVLKTTEGFSFTNMLRFLYDSKEYGYFINYVYDLLTDDHKLVISGITTDGWASSINGYIYIEGGVPVTGWKKIKNDWYLFDNNGVMQTGWKKSGGKWYYLIPGSGKMATGWKQISGKWYFFKAGGAMAAKEYCKGYWLNMDGTWTYKYKASWKKNSKGWWFGDESGWYAKSQTLKIDDKNYNFNAAGYCTNP